MHEYALADAVVAAVAATATEERLSRVLTVDVRVGALQSIRRTTFEEALQAVLPTGDARFRDAALTVTIVPAAFRCRPCGTDFEPDLAGQADEHATEAIHFVPELAHAYLRCPSCGSPDFDIVEGRGVALGRIEGERDE